MPRKIREAVGFCYSPEPAAQWPRRILFASNDLVTDRLAFRPWHGLAAHRPLGSVNRLRRAGYEELGKQRTDLNAVEGTTMRSVAELPD